MLFRRPAIAAIALLTLIAPTLAVTTASAAPTYSSTREFLISTTDEQYFSTLETITSMGGTVTYSSADSRVIQARLPESAASNLNHLTGVTVGVNKTYSINASVTGPANPSLDRIDQRAYPPNNKYNFSDKQLGAGVSIYIVDSGVQGKHPQFTGRVKTGVSFVNSLTPNGSGPGNTDCNGHGTHVAGIAAGATTGVAPKATIIPVRIFGCHSDFSPDSLRVLIALDWVMDHHTGGTPAVVNLSIGAPSDPLVVERISEVIADGITVVAAAGNNTADACQVSPANSPEAITVGAMSSANGADAISYFSNYGPCVDIFAPGGDYDPTALKTVDPIISANAALLTSRAGAQRSNLTGMVGTSQAAPFVAGAAARYLSLHKTASPDEVRHVLLSEATQNVFTDAKGSANRLLYVNPKGFTKATFATPGAPTAVTATAVSESSVAITWKAPAKGSSAITGYNILGIARGAQPVQVTAEASATSTLLEGLTSGASYRFTVTATNAAGISPRSLGTNPVNIGTPVIARKASLPGAPQSLTAQPGTNTVVLNWTDPTTDGGSPILMYIVEVSPEAGAYQASVQSTGKKTNSFEFWGLNSGVEYTFSVYSVNAAGKSEEPATVIATPMGTVVDLPPAPKNVRVVYNSGVLTATWPHEYRPEALAPITGWRVSLLDAETGKAVERLDVRNGMLLSTDFGLAKIGEKYKISVTVMSGPLIGNTFTTKVFTVSKTLAFGSALAELTENPIYQPGLEVRFAGLKISKTVTLSWTVPKGVSASGFYISWRAIDETENADLSWSPRKSVSGKSRSYTVKDMPKGDYLMRVESATPDGMGVFLIRVTKTK